MKSIVTIITTLLGSKTTRYNLAALIKLVAVLIFLVSLFSILFHILMEREGQHHSWITGFYWTLTVMSTLGFGDITFESDAGRLFSVIVLVTGVMFLLVLLPFTFIEFFYAPWMAAQEASKAPQTVPPGTERHVIFTFYGPVGKMLVRMLNDFGYQYFVLVPTVAQALEMRSEGVPVVTGDRVDPETYRKCNIDKAAMVITTLDDIANTNVTFTVRELCERVPIVASATKDSVRDALELAGVTHILRLEEMMGQALARRVIGNDAMAHEIGELDGLLIAEANPARTPLVGKTLGESNLRAEAGVTVVGLWVRGQFEPADPNVVISENTVLVLGGTRAQVDSYNEIYGRKEKGDTRVVIVGGGRVGRVTAAELTKAGVDWTIIEKIPERVQALENKVIGDASDFEILVEAGMQQATSVIITTHDDDINIFLTIFFRRLRHSMQIISRCTLEATAARLHRAGADLVLSYASMGANTIFNILRGSDTVLLAEGINIFPVSVPHGLAGKTVAESAVRSKTGCSIIALEVDGERIINPNPEIVLEENGKLVLIGSLEAERQFCSVYKPTV